MAEDDKTEEATPKRLESAREEGQFPRAQDAGNTAGAIAVIITAATTGPFAFETLRQFTIRCYSEPFALVNGDLSALALSVGSTLATVALPLVFAGAIGATAAGIYQAGFQPHMKLAAPKWERLNPLGKLKQMLAPQRAFVTISLQLARVCVVAVVAYNCVKSFFPTLLKLSRATFEVAMMEVMRALLTLAVWATIALLVLVILDYAYNKFKHGKDTRMSKQEVKDEHKQMEGDPKIKGKQRARMREMARGVSKAVSESDFVIANPTHVSVAIRYRPEEGAPVVTAKGYDEVALHIRELAGQFNVPIVTNIPLARALARRCRPGTHIPVDLYAAVAEVLAFVYRMKNKMPNVVG